MRRIERQWRRPGQGLAEYGLILTVVALASLAGVIMFGQSIVNGLKDVMGGSGSSSTPAVAAIPADGGTGGGTQSGTTIASTGGTSSGGGPSTTPATSAPAIVPSAGQMSVTLADGTKLIIGVPNDITQTVSTAGANGATQMLAQSLIQMAQQLEADGKITAADADAVSNLANYAYKMADMEKFIADHVNASTGSVAGMDGTPVTYDGVTYSSVQELALQMGPSPTGSYGPVMAKLWDYYGAVAGTDVFNKNPDLLNVINGLTSEINQLGNANAWALPDMTASPFSSDGKSKNINTQLASFMADNGYTDTAAKLQNSTGDQVTAGNGTGICTTGGDTSNGSKCQ